MSVHQFGDCELDLDGYELRRDGEAVHIEPQVFDVLAYLVAHRDRVVPKAELLEAVWGERFVGEAALTSRIKQARRAVGDDGGRQGVIATVRGRGYRFVAPVTGPPADARSEPPSAHRSQEIHYCFSEDAVRVAYALTGAGTPLVKVANWLTHLDREWSNPVWSHWLDALAERYRLIRYDERGCGLSDWEVPNFGFDAWVDDLELVVDTVGLERFPLLGISQGGAVAIAYAVRHPEKVTHLILTGAYSRGRIIRAETPQDLAEATLDLGVARVGWLRDDSAFRRVFASQFLPDASQELWDAFNELQRATTSIDNVIKFLDVFARIDVSELASRVRCPTLVLHMRGDLRVPQAQAHELATLIPDSRLVLLDSRNHILTEHEPAWPAFLTEIDRFLAPALTDGV